MTQLLQGTTIPLAAVRCKTTVPNPRFMIRDDGVVLPFNHDVWDVDQRGKRRLRCVAHLPASYLRKLNEIRRKTEESLRAQAQYTEEFAESEKRRQQDAARSAADAQTILHDIGFENMQADVELEGHARIAAPADFLLSMASKEDIIAYARDELHVPVDEALTADELRIEVAQMMGVEIPPEVTAAIPPAPAQPTQPVRRPPPAAASAPAPPRRVPGAAPAIGMVE